MVLPRAFVVVSFSAPPPIVESMAKALLLNPPPTLLEVALASLPAPPLTVEKNSSA